MLDTPHAAGFEDMTLQSQSAFHIIMQAMAHPGRIYAAPEPVACPAPMGPVAAMAALTLCDYDTPVWRDPALVTASELDNFLRFHTGAPFTESRDQASFAFISDAKSLDNLALFGLGSDEYPDESTTLVIEVDALTNSTGVTLEGPGIENTQIFSAAPLPAAFWAMAKANHALYPRGVDMIFVTEKSLACLPRSTRITKGA